MTAYLLQKQANVPIQLTIYEASPRLGGKVLTPRFRSCPARYEAGAAEFYDYSPVDEDPLKELVAELGLAINPMSGQSVVMNGRFIGNLDDVQLHFGHRTRESLQHFDGLARDQISRKEFFHSGGAEDAGAIRPLERFDVALDSIGDPTARRFIENLLHSDLATEPARTGVGYGLQNYLMNDPKYLKYYSIEGGNEQLPRALANRISGTVRLEHAVCRVERSAAGTLSVRSRHGEQCRDDEFDFVVVALPHDALPSIDFAGERLRAAVARHHAYYDHPAHYLRITLLFERPFWRGVLVDSYCMSDRMGGSCLYEESSREPEPRYGVLGWLVGGNAALSRSDRDDHALIAEALDSLPDSLAQGRDSFLEGRVHRWVGAVNAMPGGVEYHSLDQRHRPEACDHPNLLVVGDYLFDSTLNGVFDSATYAADWLAAMMNDEAPSNPPRRPQ